MGEFADKLAAQSPAFQRAYLGSLAPSLVKSGKLEKYYKTLTDFDFITAKINYLEFGVQPLIDDYDLIDDVEILTHPEYNAKTVKALKLIQRALDLSKHILERDKTQLAAQLWGRLQCFQLPEIQAMLVSAKQSENTWLRPLACSLARPTGQLLRTFVGHGSEVKSVAITPDGKQVISGSSDNTIIIWDFKTGQKLFTLEGHTKPVIAVAVTPDGKRIVSGSEDTTLKVWDLYTAKEICTLNGHTSVVNTLAITSDSRKVISGSEDATLRVWNLKTRKGYCLKAGTNSIIEGGNDNVKAVSITHDDKWVISCWSFIRNDGEHFSSWEAIEIFNLENINSKTIKINEGKNVNSLAINKDNKLVVSYGEEAKISICNLENLFKQEANFNIINLESLQQKNIKFLNFHPFIPIEFITFTGHTQQVKAVTFTQDGKRIISASEDKTLIVWDWENNNKLLTLEAHTDSVNTITLTPDGKHIISGSSDKTLKVWNLEIEEELNVTNSEQLLEITDMVGEGCDRKFIFDSKAEKNIFHTIKFTDSVNAINITPDGTVMISVLSNINKNLKIYNLTEKQEIATINLKKNSVSNKNILLVPSIAITNNIKYLIYDIKKSILSRYALESRKKTFFLNVPLFYLEAAKNSLLMFSLTVLIIVGYEILEIFKEYKLTGDLFFMTFLIYLYISGFLLFSINDFCSTKLSSFVDKNFSSIIISPDDERVISCYYKSLNVWNIKTKKKLFTLKGHTNRVTSIAISPNGKYLISGSVDKTLKVWNLKTGKELFTLKGHNDRVTSVAVTADGQQVISASKDKTLKIWDLEKRLELFTLIDNKFADTVVVTPNGKQVISGSWLDNIIKVWDLESKKVIASFSGDSELLCCTIVSDGVTIIVGEKSGRLHFLRLEGIK
ncbi:WD-40 repeat protein [Tolypothrix tenuis PCC 7101]|uniref:WD-40 repeat protein n=1 Tax=Tolypothrix tenuis PCC 7101 TaxID=231146 RepID=A0A1Z4MYS4_9CYAN|nr:WD40 repeat domain-containing protein [Aulosira sp. FACHB-113]BAY98624.1 WD-40 repeat protein [Tolypothrix tenuis PCC 7101]BAZ77458.1 WD-40 repeat protein [Aulosira laxa NIES-50]